MTDLVLEVGKSYVVRKAIKSAQISRIVGKVLPGTIEFDKGLRFFTDDGICFKENGESVTYLKDPKHPWKGRENRFDLVREAAVSDIPDILITYAGYSEDDLQNRNRFIPVDDPGFSMKLGCVYINRFGLPILIFRSTVMKSGDILFRGTSFYGRTHVYTDKGRIKFSKNDSHNLSMGDISHLKVG